MLPRKATPFDPYILLDIFKYVDITSKLHVTVWCILLVGFYCMFRISQMCQRSFKSNLVNNLFFMDDIAFVENGVLLNVKWSKKMQFGQRRVRIPSLCIPYSPLCPITALKLMQALSPVKGNSPIFVDRDSRPLLYDKFVKIFRSLQKTSRDHLSFSSHSMRSN